MLTAEDRAAKLRLTKPSRCGTAGKGRKRACLGLPAAFSSELGQGNHTPSPGAQLRQGVWLWGPVQWCRECETVIGHWTRGPPLPAVGC